MVKAGLMRRAKGGVKLLGNGEFKAKVDFAVYGASKSAMEAVEKAGGSVKILAPAEGRQTQSRRARTSARRWKRQGGDKPRPKAKAEAEPASERKPPIELASAA